MNVQPQNLHTLNLEKNLLFFLFADNNDNNDKLIFMVTPCINDINPFLVQLMHFYSLLKQD